METVILTILLIFSVSLVGIVLLQRSEGGGLGLGGGGGGGGVMSTRGAATALTKVTWFLGIGFFAAAMALTVISARNAANSSVVTDITIEGTPAPVLPGDVAPPPASAPAPSVEDLMPPPAEDPQTPPPAE